jgi:RNA polymerase sigma-70 factor (ECF subfamily)
VVPAWVGLTEVRETPAGGGPARSIGPVMAPTATTSDVDLVEMARQGDRFAFDRLLLRHDERMRGLAFRLLADRHAMDDALHEAYLDAFRGLAGFKPGRDFGRWLYRVTYNACVDEIRRRKGRPGSDQVYDQAADAAAAHQALTTAEVVRQALSELPPAQRITVVLVDGEGFDHDAVSDILGVAPGTVASRLHRARTSLRRALWDAVQ